MRKFILHVLIILFVFLLVPTTQAASYEDEKRLEDAKEEVRINPDDAEAHGNLGYAYYETGKYKEAIESYKQAIRLDPDDTLGYILLSNVYYRIGEREKWEKLRKKALKIDPYDIGNIVELGLGYAEMGDIDSAFEMYKRLKKLNNPAAKGVLEAISRSKE